MLEAMYHKKTRRISPDGASVQVPVSEEGRGHEDRKPMWGKLSIDPIRIWLILLVLASVVSVFLTYVTITREGAAFEKATSHIIVLVVLNFICVLSLVGLVTKRLMRLVVARKQGLEGSRLQTRIVVMFSLVATIPAVVMGLFSLLFFYYGIQAWFNKRVSTAIEESVAVAQGYFDEHKKIIRADIIGMANDFNRESLKITTPQEFNKILSILAVVRKIPEAIVFQPLDKRILARTTFSYSLEFTLEDLGQDIIRRAALGELVILTSEQDDRVIALIKLENFFDAYLLVGRLMDSKIISHIESTEGAANEYQRLKSDISVMQIKFYAAFIIISLIILAVVVWYGIQFAAGLVRPVGALVAATEKIKKGDWDTRVEEGEQDDEIAVLSRAFNRMVDQLNAQRKEIVSIQTRAAWADVARRVAHEIKNPLTPIHLAAERLQRKYLVQIAEGDKSNFSRYTATIIRHVEDIGKMVEEFVNYARMPAPEFASHDISRLLKDIIFSRECANNNITYKVSLPQEAMMFTCDARQMHQVFTNIFKNAEESIAEKKLVSPSGFKGKIYVSLTGGKGHYVVTVEDNGKGFPSGLVERLAEPYVTTKAKGTGLGLAIVKKIIEDHKGDLIFENKPEGARVIIKFFNASGIE